ncbi:MAG: hypothetical protein OEM81_04530 [Acidimicrobiia bacterium]|nr:hypothetical protein [Acidimicrobiia bacterium]MDH3397081.1 hypothetical protein [Acidimicrobiia bacterium]
MEIQAGRDRATEFLLTGRDRRGWWRDFDTLAGASDEWVTAYVAVAIAGEPEQRAREAARHAWRLLRRRRRWERGWGYNRRVPTDADSTLWALQLAERMGNLGGRRASRALDLVARHARPSGAVATFRSAGRIGAFTKLSGSISFAGWCGDHVCVTAAADIPEYAGHQRAVEYLRSVQNADGSWTGYWWADDEYPTMLAGRMLGRAAAPDNLERLQRAALAMCSRVDVVGAVATRWHPSGSSFATACAAETMARWGPDSVLDRLERAAGWLLATQAADGAWAASASLRIPPPNVVDPQHHDGWVASGRGAGSIIFDQNRNYTAATVLSSLRAIQTRLEVSPSDPAPPLEVTPIRSATTSRRPADKAPASPVEITGRDNVITVLRDPESFSSSIMAAADPVLLGADPPAHTRTRRALTQALSDSRVAALEPEVRSLAARLVGQIFTRGTGDLVGDFAKPLPVATMGWLLGLDGVPLADLGRWSDAVVLAGTGVRQGGDSIDSESDLAELEEALVALVDRLQRAPGADLISSILHGLQALAAEEAVSVARLLLVAGNETTTHLIGNALVALFAAGVPPRARLSDQALLGQVLWTRPPVARVYRLVTQETAIGERSLAARTVVAANLAAANGAETPDAESTRLADLVSNLAFGAGPHRCPGARLALLEAQAALAAIRPRLHEMELQVDPERISMLESDRLTGPTHLPVVVSRRAVGTA